jgi:hypothetical protein
VEGSKEEGGVRRLNEIEGKKADVEDEGLP